MISVLDYPQDSLSTDSLRRIHENIAQFSQRSALDNASIITDFLSGDEFRSLIQMVVTEICSDEQALRLCTARSQSHPLGFNKLLIFSTEHYQVRLNFWPVIRLKRELEDIHDHRFDFASTILTGNLIAELYEIVDSGTPMVHFIDRLPANYDDPYILEETGPVHARRVSVHRLARGSAYITRCDSLHRIIAAEDAPVVTAFVKFAPTRADSNVLISPSATENREIQTRHRFSSEATLSTLSQILALISN